MWISGGNNPYDWPKGRVRYTTQDHLDAQMNATRIEYIYVAPAEGLYSVQAIPQGLGLDEDFSSVVEILEAYRDSCYSKEIGQMTSQLELVHIEPAYADLRETISGLRGGEFFEALRPIPRKCPPELADGAEVVIEVLRDTSCSMARVQMDGKTVQEGNNWDFHPNCWGAQDDSPWPRNHLAIKKFKGPEDMAEVLEKALTAEGFQVKVKRGYYDCRVVRA